MSKIVVNYEDFVIIKSKLNLPKVKIEQVLGTIEHIVEERMVDQTPPIKVKDLSTNFYCQGYSPADLVPISAEQCVEIANLAQTSQKEAIALAKKIVAEFKDEVALPNTGQVVYRGNERMLVVELTEDGGEQKVAADEDIPIVPEAGPVTVSIDESLKKPAAVANILDDLGLSVPQAKPLQVKQEAEKYGFSLGEPPQEKKQIKLWPESGYSEAYLHTLENGMRIMLYSRFGAQREDVTIVNFVLLRGAYPNWNCHLNYSTKQGSEVYISTTCFTTEEEKALLEKAVTQLYNEGKVVKVTSSDEARHALSQFIRSRA